MAARPSWLRFSGALLTHTKICELVNELVNRLSWPGVHLNEVRDPETKGPNRALRWRTPRQIDGNHDTPSRVANTVLLKSALV